MKKHVVMKLHPSIHPISFPAKINAQIGIPLPLRQAQVFRVPHDAHAHGPCALAAQLRGHAPGRHQHLGGLRG